jgi:DNA primase
VYAAAFQAPEGAAAREYASRRGLGAPVLEGFGIGWASESGHALANAAQRDKKAAELLIEAGLLRRNESGRLYDFFRGRLMIPIRDRLGRVLGFGGRMLASEPDAPGPKYVNTPETPLFRKGSLIFGLDLAADSIRSSRELLLVEGYTDVMAAHQAGWKNAGAVLGTATTDEHAALIRRTGARSIVLVFDGDAAGRKASVRALMGLLKLPVELRVATLPEGRDPGDLLVDPAGSEVFRARVDGALDWFDACVEGLRGKRGSELSGAVEELFQLLFQLPRPIERSSRLAELARALALPEGDVREQWSQFERARRSAPRPAAPLPALPRAPAKARPAASEGGASEASAYALLLGALLLDNSLVPLYAHLAAECPEGDVGVLFRTFLALYERDDSGASIDASALMTALSNHPRSWPAIRPAGSSAPVRNARSGP